MKLSVVITVYNEKNTVLEAINQIKQLNLEKQILVVDNCSTDGTREILQGINDPSLEIVYQTSNHGYGSSIMTAARLAKGEYLYVHNSDLEYDPDCLYKMLELCQDQQLDAVFGSRLINRSGQSWLSIARQRPYYLGTLITTALINLLYHKKLTDIIGTRFYRVETLKKLNPRKMHIGFDFEVASKLCKLGCVIKEVEVKYKPRTVGKKVKPIDIFPAVWEIIRVKFTSTNSQPK